MPKWEYKLVVRNRGWPGGFEPKEGTKWNVDIEALLPQLGDEGWELVAVTPRSDFFGQSAAGFTTSDVWVFKRPKTV